MQVFDGSCSLIPVKIIAEECKKLSKDFIVELVEMLSSEMNPNVVCSTAGLCNSVRVDKLLQLYHRSVGVPEHYLAAGFKNECDVCKEQSKKIADKIADLTEQDVELKLLELCGYLGAYSDACKATVRDDFNLIYSVLADVGHGDLCDLVGLCSESIQDQPARYSSADVQCEFCEKVIQHWVTVWTANTTEQEFKEVLEGLCRHLDKTDRVQHCLHIVDDYYLPWFNFLLHEINPRAICQFVGLCGNGRFFGLNAESSITTLLGPRGGQHEQPQSVPMTPIQPAQTLIGGYFVPQTALVMGKPGCVICEYALHELQSWLGDFRTEQKIESGLRYLCGRLPNSVRDECDNFVNTYGPAVVQLLIHDVDPGQICPRLSLCVSGGGGLLGHEDEVSSLPDVLQRPIKASETCALCEFALDEIYGMLNDTSDRQEILNVLDTFCFRVMPSSIEGKCEKLVDSYSGFIIDMILESYTPDEICKALKLCKSQVSSATTPSPDSAAVATISKSDQKCVLCEYLITTLDQIIGDKHNEEEVRQALDQVCGILPKSIHSQCTQFVDKYTDMIIDMITKSMTPDQICQALGLCQQRRQAVEGRPHGRFCALCEYAIAEVDKMVEDKQNEKKIKDALDQVCAKLGSKMEQECKNIVDEYLDEVIQMFVQQYQPEQVCRELKFCFGPTLIGDDDDLEDDLEDEEIRTNALSQTGATRPATLTQKPLCALCEFAVTELENELVNNRTLDMVERGVQFLCAKLLPDAIAEPCEKFVDEFGDELIHLLMQAEFDPENACAAMNLCRRMPAVRVDERPCVWGPSYWCQSRFHAKVCGTLEHCERNVWN